MNITLTGVSGFLGRKLIDRLQLEGHSLNVLGRRPMPGLKFSQWDTLSGEPPEDALLNADAVIHLAGEPVAQRWTPEAKKRIRDTRVAGTRRLIHGLTTLSKRPQVLISASAIGIYGSRGDELLTEMSAPGDGFLADVCVGWEREADMAEVLGMRVVKVRLGVVLGSGGGALEKILPPFRLGAGGKLGSGKQWMSWIHIDDVIGLFLFALHMDKIRGPLNATAPTPVRNSEFTADLGHALHRPAIIPVPGFALKMAFGEMADVLLGSQRVLPDAASKAGFKFRFPELPAALDNLLSVSSSAQTRPNPQP